MTSDELADLIAVELAKYPVVPEPINWAVRNALKRFLLAAAEALEVEMQTCPAFACDNQISVLADGCLRCHNGFAPKFVKSKFLTRAIGG